MRICNHKWWLCLFGISFVAGTANAGMSTPGSLTANESGAALYTIPIEIPPGVAGVAPILSMVHNSQGGNALLGMGWSLTGLSSITRCAQTKAQDGITIKRTVNYDSNDRFCLDGERLIAVSGVYGASGTEYRTERDSFTRVISYGTAGNGPEKFKVWTKSGQTMEYGFTSDSRIEAVKAAYAMATWPIGTVTTWAMNTHTDTKGNYFTITYTEDSANGDSYPSRIDYTGNFSVNTLPTNAVQFVYEDRVDVVPIYHAGAVAKTRKRLKTIQVLTNNSLVREYRITYQYGVQTMRSAIAKVELCAPDNTCILPIEFGYSTNSVAFAGHNSNSSGRDFIGFQYELADFNGDGKTDYMYIADGTVASLPRGAQRHVFLSNGDQTFSAPIQSNASQNLKGYELVMGDYNGDGFADIMYIRDTQENGYYRGQHRYVYLGRGDGTFNDPIYRQLSENYNYFDLVPGDFNGDGRTDYMYISNGGANTSSYHNSGWERGVQKRVHLSNGDGTFSAAIVSDEHVGFDRFTLLVGDYNGDGNTDLMYISGDKQGSYYKGQKRRIFFSNGDGNFKPAFVTTDSGGSYWNWDFVTGDYNGDGKTDLMAITNGGTENGIVSTDKKGARTDIFFSNGDGTFQFRWSRATTGDFTGYNFVSGDYNGDGKTDYMYITDGSGTVPGNSQRTVYLSMGNGSFSGAISTSGNVNFNGSGYKFLSGDFNGDGKSDYMYLHSQGYFNYVYHATPTEEMLDVPLTFTVAKDYVTTAVYRPLSNNAVYTRDRNAIYPIVDIQSPLYVLSSMTISDGIGGTLTTNYKYGGLKADMNGSGMLGFRWIETNQVETGLSTRTEFRQDWPYMGMPSVLRKTLAGHGNNGLLSESSNSFACIDTATAAACATTTKRFFPYVSQNVSRTWDLDGSAMPTITTNNDYDVWGNAKQITVSHSDGHSKTTVNTFSPADTGNWYLGRLVKSTVTNITP